jgi:hypothetical protein
VTSASPSFVPVSDAPVTVAPDEDAVIALAIRIPPCGAYPDGGSLAADRVRVRVRSSEGRLR